MIDIAYMAIVQLVMVYLLIVLVYVHPSALSLVKFELIIVIFECMSGVNYLNMNSTPIGK